MGSSRGRRHHIDGTIKNILQGGGGSRPHLLYPVQSMTAQGGAQRESAGDDTPRAIDDNRNGRPALIVSNDTIKKCNR